MPNSERRFFLKVCKQMHNAEKFKELFALAKDAGVCEIFFQFLRTVDTSKIEIGRAPLTTVKLESMSAQAAAGDQVAQVSCDGQPQDHVLRPERHTRSRGEVRVRL